MRTVLAMTLTLMVVSAAEAQPLDDASRFALTETLRVLQDPTLRRDAIARNPRAASVDSHIRSIAGGEALTQEFYDLAADVFSELTVATGGNAQKMSDALDRGKNNPAEFASMLSPRTLERLRALSIKLSDQRR